MKNFTTLLLGCTLSLNAWAQANAPATGGPRFIVISDTHFGNHEGEGPMVKVPQALRHMLGRQPDADAIFVCGDLTDWGLPAQYEQFMQVFNDTTVVPARIPYYVMMGNHDNYADHAADNFGVLGQPFHRLIDIKGYPFITTSMDGGGWDDYAPEEVQALADNLKTAAERYPGKPIFVFTHVPPMNTVYGTCKGEGGWGSNVLTETLKAYPQVILFGGHSHFPLSDPRSIHQHDFTTVNDGSVTYSEIEPGVVSEGIHPARYDYVTEGCIVTVDSASNVEIQRWDSYADEEILPRWQVNAPHDGSRFIYTDARTGGAAPQWQAGSTVAVTDIAGEGCTVSFPQAQDDENVHHYVVDLLDGDETVATLSVFSGYYLNSRMPRSLSVRFEGIPDGRQLRASVRALDSYKNVSVPLQSAAFSTPVYRPAEGTQLPVADLFDLKVSRRGKASDASARRVAIVTGEDAPAPCRDAAFSHRGATFSGSADCFYRVDYAADAAIRQAFTQGFTYEVLYRPATADNVCPLSAQEGGGAGIEQAKGGLIQFYCHVGGGYRTLKSSVTAQPGKWYHVVATYDAAAGQLRLYVNGRPSGQMAVKGKFGFPADEKAQWIGIGGDANASDRTQFSLKGDILAARMYSSPVSRDQVYLLYHDQLRD